jgi:hypothetical protein
MSDANSAPVYCSWQLRVAAELGVVRTQLQRALREQHFTLMGDTLTSLEATRGSQLAALVMQHDNLPMTAHIHLQPLEGACEVSVQLQEAGKVPSRYLGVRGAYQRGLADVQARLDEYLAALDPNLQVGPTTATPLATDGVGEQFGTAAGNFGRAVVGKANRVLEGKDHSEPTAWKALDEVVFVSSKGQAEVDDDRVEGMLAVAGLVSTQPGSMPANLAHDVETFTAGVESTLDNSGGAQSVRVEVSDQQIPVLAFLATQAAIRESLPLRTLHVCTTCRLERVTNPDYERMKERHRKLLALSTGLGSTIGRRGITPFVIVGQLVRVKKLDPDFVCTRCQGTTADEWVVTYCPKCGDRRQEAVLRACPKCKYDFRKGAEMPELWHPAPPPLPEVIPDQLGLAPAQMALAPAQMGLPASTSTDATIVAPSAGQAAVAGLAAPAGVVAAAAPDQAAAGSAGTTGRVATTALPPAGWYPDSWRRYSQRWWDGSQWTQYVYGPAGQSVDPVPSSAT